jgi:hypothetical protein
VWNFLILLNSMAAAKQTTAPALYDGAALEFARHIVFF